MAVALFVYLLAIVCWLGAVIFFSFFVAPIVFTRLPAAAAGKVVAGIFPLYYMLGYAAGVLATALGVYFYSVRGAKLWWGAATVALTLALLATLYAGLAVRPQVDAIRSVAEEPQPDPVRKAQFDHLHRMSVILNGAVMVLNIVALAASAKALSERG
ncbi:MAG: DUF4149 domain-containing protein [Candidatus Binataceae bacterium]